MNSLYINFNLLCDSSEKITFDDILGNHLLTNLVCYGEDGDDEGGIETITYFIEQIDNDYQYGMYFLNVDGGLE